MQIWLFLKRAKQRRWERSKLTSVFCQIFINTHTLTQLLAPEGKCFLLCSCPCVSRHSKGYSIWDERERRWIHEAGRPSAWLSPEKAHFLSAFLLFLRDENPSFHTGPWWNRADLPTNYHLPNAGAVSHRFLQHMQLILPPTEARNFQRSSFRVSLDWLM